MGLNEVIAAGLKAASDKGAELLGKSVEVSARSIQRGGWEAAAGLTGFTLAVPFALSGEVSGPGVLLLEGKYAALMVDLMLNNDPAELPADLPDALRDAAAEPLAQMVGGLAEGFGRASRRRVQVAAGQPAQVGGDGVAAARAHVKEDRVLVADCELRIGHHGPGRFALVLSGSQADILSAERAGGGAPELQLGAGQHSGPGGTLVQPAQFGSFQAGAEAPAMPANLDLLMDVQLDVTVELGRAVRKVRDVLGLGPGSIVELNKLAGEPVDLLVNGKPIAKAEVVVIDENFAVRIIEILGRDERLSGGL